MSPSSADRNLLFGVLALQMDFVTRDQLVAGMTAWAVEKATPLADILARQGALKPELKALLETLVAKHLEAHGDDPKRGLAAVSSLGSVKEELDRLGDSQLSLAVAAVATDHYLGQRGFGSPLLGRIVGAMGEG